MGHITTIGLDLAKSVFQVHAIDEAGKVMLRKRPTPLRDHIPLGGVVRRGAGRSDGSRPSLDCNSTRSVNTSA